jgi:hypothetical protein
MKGFVIVVAMALLCVGMVVSTPYVGSDTCDAQWAPMYGGRSPMWFGMQMSSPGAMANSFENGQRRYGAVQTENRRIINNWAGGGFGTPYPANTAGSYGW